MELCMARANLSISIKNAMNVAAASAEPSRPNIPLPDPPAQFQAPRRPSLRGRLFGRIADYARRYLTASVEHRLTLVQVQQDGVRDQLEAVLTLQDAVRERLETTKDRLEALSAQVERLDAAIASIGRDLRDLPGLMGPRFDELDIKVRPLIDFDEASYAVRLRDGYAMVPRQEPIFAVMVANASSGGLEPGTRRVLTSLIRPGMGVADVGANVGLLTLSCAVAAGPSGQVYAFEPEPGPRSQLEKTLKLNGLSWVRTFDQAVGAVTEQRTFHISPVIGHSSLYALPPEDGLGRDVTVQVTRLDDVIGPGQRLDVVKIDVEGAELDVLVGMARLLRENLDLAIIAEYGPAHLERVGLTPTAWFDAFQTAGFEAHAIEEPTGVCRPVSASDLADVASINIAFVRPKGAASARLPQ
jgi:FkbM family methyltransferase